MNDTITVILNGYERGLCLNEQYNALQQSTIKPNEILLWYNQPEIGDINYDIMEKVPTAFSNLNMGVWARFSYALNAKSEYICIFDDDMIPGKKWLENCMSTMKTHTGLLGSVGLLYLLPNPPQNSSYYEKYIRFGWINNGHVDISVQVDLVGHVWFFKKEWLSYFWRELPDPKYNICGEDMHFSYMLQKYANIKTYVPPHPINDKEMWGNIIDDKYAADSNSLWETNKESLNGEPFKNLMNEFFIDQRKNGWKLINEK
jgi:hypothetical protein